MKKILLIEDDPILQKMYEDKFRQGDFEIILASDGEKGLEEAVKNHPDFIILDLRLPNLNGWEVLKRLKADPLVKDIPVAVLTVMQDDLALKEDPGIMENIIAYWRKDQATPSEVYQNVEKYLKENG